MEEKCRCSWAGDVPVYVDYHDNEWGRPTHDDRMLFELLVLEGAQAGLSWLTILKKREAYREAFDGFDPAKVRSTTRPRSKSSWRTRGSCATASRSTRP